MRQDIRFAFTYAGNHSACREPGRRFAKGLQADREGLWAREPVVADVQSARGPVMFWQHAGVKRDGATATTWEPAHGGSHRQISPGSSIKRAP